MVVAGGCQVFNNNIEETETFSITVTGETYKINHHLSAVIINASFTLSLVKFVVNNIATGKTAVVDKFRSQWNNYK